MSESKEAVALELFKIIGFGAGKVINPSRPALNNGDDRKWALDLYAQCLAVMTHAGQLDAPSED